MKYQLVRTQQGTFIGQVHYKEVPYDEALELNILYFPAMVDFIDIPSMLPIGQATIKTKLHIVDWPCSEMKIEAKPILHSILDDNDEKTSSKLFIDAYKLCIKNAWKTGKIVS